ncbi:hypothetical protein JNUCC64_19170 [Streptomyces sp. JNUCC 64]
MSGIASRLLEQIEADEHAFAAAAGVARGVLSRHPGLPVSTVIIDRSGGFEVRLRLPDADAVRAWSLALTEGGASVRTLVEPTFGCRVFEYVTADATVHGHRVHLIASRILPDAEATAWRTGQNTAGTGAAA